MGCGNIVTLFVFAILSLTSAFNTLVPADRELIYGYNALVKAGTDVPTSYASQFILQGKLHIQANSNATFVKFSGLSYKLYNGVLDHIHENEAHDVPLRNEVKDLQKVFKIVYNTHGKVIGIATENDEKEFTRNIKKAIASVLQLDVDNVFQHQNFPRAFISEEQSIYDSHDKVRYNVLPHSDFIVVHKMHEMPNSNRMYSHSTFNTEFEYCDAQYDEPIAHDSQREYMIANEDGHHIVKHIDAHGGIYYYPFKGMSEAQFVFVNQTFHLLEKVEIKDHFKMTSEHYDDDVLYHMYEEDFETNDVVPDISNGRRHIDYQKWTSDVHKMLEDIWVYLGKDHINTQTPNIEQGQIINRLQRLLMFFNYQRLEELHNTLAKKTSEHDVHILRIYHQMLPLIGTKSSSLFIKYLVAHNKVSVNTAVEMLQNMPRNIKTPNHKMVTEMEDMIHWDNQIPWSVRKTAILSFASIVGRAYAFEKNLHGFKHHKGHSFMTESFHYKDHDKEDSDILRIENLYERYVIQYLHFVRNASSHDVVKEQKASLYDVEMAYLVSLYNMKILSVVKHLKPAIKGEWWSDHHHRLLSMWTASPVILKNSDYVYEIFWPIFTNPQEHTELRIAAYMLIMQSQPTMSRLLNMFWQMQYESNQELYHYHYSFMHATKRSTDPCQSKLSHHIAQLVPYMHPPSHGLSTYQVTDFVDSKYNFGSGWHGMSINTNVSMIYLSYRIDQIFSKYTERYLHYVKIHGLDFWKDMFKIDTNKDDYSMFNMENMVKLLTEHQSDPQTHIEYILVKHHHVVSSHFFDHNSMDQLFTAIWPSPPKMNSPEKQWTDIDYHHYTKVFFPTDIGFPMVWDMLLPEVNKNTMGVNMNTVNKVANIHLDYQNVEWTHGRHGLSFYNPIVDVWQGINKYHSYDSVLSLYWDISINMEQQSMKWSFKIRPPNKNNVIGFRSHATSMVFVKDDFGRNLLEQSSPKSMPFQYVSHGEKYRHNYTLSSEDDLNTGMKSSIVAFDMEKQSGNGTYLQDYLGDWTMTFMNFQRRMILLPSPGPHGFMMRLEPSTEHDVTNIDVSFRWDYQMKHEGYTYTPGVKYSTRLTYAIKNEERSLKTWDVNTMLEMNPGHTVNNLKMHFTRIIPGQKDYKICVDGVKKWNYDEITGHMNIAMSQTPDGKCQKDDTVIDITMTGQKSEEQTTGDHVYGACSYPVPYGIPRYHTMQCLAAHSSLRKNIYNVKTQNVPSEFQKYFNIFWEYFKGYYMLHYNFRDEHQVKIDEHNIKIEVMYPMYSVQNDEVDINIYTPKHWHSMTNLPTGALKQYGLEPDTAHYSSFFMWMHRNGLVDHCKVHDKNTVFNGHSFEQHVPNEWTMYVGDQMDNAKQGVYVKHIGEHQMALKLVDHGHQFEVEPHGDSYKCIIDGKDISGDKTSHWEEWMSYQVFEDEPTHHMVITMPHSGLHVEYDGTHVQTVVPKVDHKWHGRCYKQF